MLTANQEACCVVCDLPGNISDQLFCTSCGQHYHGNCLDPAVEVNPIVRAGWQCPECKICQTCRYLIVTALCYSLLMYFLVFFVHLKAQLVCSRYTLTSRDQFIIGLNTHLIRQACIIACEERTKLS